MAKTKGKSAATAPKAKVNPSAPASQIAPRGTAGEAYKFRNRTKSARAGLIFPVNTVLKRLQQGQYADKVGVGAAVYMAAALEYLTTELVEICGEASAANKRKRINPRHVMLSVRTDDEFSQLLKDVTIASSGVPVNIHNVLLPKPTRKPKSKSGRKKPVPTAAPGHGGDDTIEEEGGEEEEYSEEE